MNANAQRVTRAVFSIDGAALTQLARNLVLDDEPGRAYRLIAEGLGGCPAAVAAAIGVVKGESRLIGDSNVGVDLEDDDSSEADEYCNAAAWLYAGRVRHKGQWVRPTGVITAWGYADAKHAGFRDTSKSAFAAARASYYAPTGGLAALAHVPLVLADQPARERWVVFEPCSEPPQWVTPALTLDAAVERTLAAGRVLEEMGPGPESGYERPAWLAEKIIREDELDKTAADELREAADEAEDAAHAAQCREIGERVREQAGDDVFPLTLKDGRVVQVARAPFTHWALERLPEDVPRELPKWDVVAPSGIKMPCDSRYHTDWVLGAGLDPTNCYGENAENINGPAWERLLELQTAAIDAAEVNDA